MHWYWFQVFTIRSSRASPEATWNFPRRLTHRARRAARAASTFASESNRACSAHARAVFTTPGADHFSARGFSAKPRRNTRLLCSPGARARFTWNAATGDHPAAVPPARVPRSTAAGASNPPYSPVKAKRSVSTPSTGALTE